MRKRILSVILCILCISASAALCACGGNGENVVSEAVSTAPVESAAVGESSAPDESSAVAASIGFTYEINEDGTTCTVTGLDDSSKYEPFIDIPETIDGLTVTAVGKKAFYSNKKLNGVTVPGTAKTIGANAFAGCSNLTAVELSEGLEEICQNAFSTSGIDIMVLPDSVKTVDAGAFRNCGKLVSIDFGAGMETLGESVCANCASLATARFAAGPSEIPKAAFSSCYSLTEICLGEGVEIIGDNAFAECQLLKTIKLPSTLKKVGVNAFYARGKYIDPETGEYGAWQDIGAAVYFAGTLEQWFRIEFCSTPCDGIADLYIDGRITDTISINDAVHDTNNLSYYNTIALSYCKSLKELWVDFDYIGDNAFAYCVSLETVVTGLHVKTISTRVFANCEKLTSVTLTSSLDAIGYAAFEGCVSLTDIYYLGPKALWDQLNKGDYWDYGMPAYTVHCEDGDIVPDKGTS